MIQTITKSLDEGKLELRNCLSSIKQILSATCSGGDSAQDFGCELELFSYQLLEDKLISFLRSFQHFYSNNWFQNKYK